MLNNKRMLTIIVVLIALIIIGYFYYKIVSLYRYNNIFAQTAEKYSEENANPIFKIEKILIYSDANIEDLSENSDLANINISQYTDFVIYIDNKVKNSELTAENTINKVYIDNIAITPTNFGNQKVFYKSVQDICNYKKIESGVNRIDYTVIHTNEEKENVTDINAFYTDCSEPLILSYVNENIVQNEDVSRSNEKLYLDGSMLKYLGIALEELNYKISFTLNIENNLGDKYACNVSLNINLDSDEGGIYTGYIMQIYDLTSYNYKFRKV